MRLAPSTLSRTANAARRIGTAPFSPLQAMNARSAVEKRAPTRVAMTVTGRATTASASISTTPSNHVRQLRELKATVSKLNAATGPTALFVPLRGVSLYATEGQVFHDAVADEALFEALRENVDRARVE